MTTEFAYRGAGFALLWILLGGGAPGSWVVGVPAILLALFVSIHYAPPSRDRVRWGAAPGFVAFMVMEMVRGGFQTAALALGPMRRLRPGFITLHLEPAGAARRNLFINTVNLIPGTVSIAIEGDTIMLHVLDVRADTLESCRRLERRVSALFREAAA